MPTRKRFGISKHKITQFSIEKLNVIQMDIDSKKEHEKGFHEKKSKYFHRLVQFADEYHPTKPYYFQHKTNKNRLITSAKILNVRDEDLVDIEKKMSE